MTDDEKFLFKDLAIEKIDVMLRENVKDIIACGFNPKKTFVFSDFSYVGGKLWAPLYTAATDGR